VLAPVERLERVDLESVDRERVPGDEFVSELGPPRRPAHVSAGRRRTTSHPNKMARK